MPLPGFLSEGYRQFRSSAFARSEDRYRKLAIEGQQPGALVIACCDSRSAPEAIFSSGPGEVFVLRNVANLVPLYEPDAHLHGTSAAIEYAVDVLGVDHVVVLGHAGCGGIQAALGAQTPAQVNTQRAYCGHIADTSPRRGRYIVAKSLRRLAHPTRFERVASAFGEAF